MYPVDANAVFVALPEKLIRGLRESGWEIHDFIGGRVSLHVLLGNFGGGYGAVMKDILAARKT